MINNFLSLALEEFLKKWVLNVTQVVSIKHSEAIVDVKEEVGWEAFKNKKGPR